MSIILESINDSKDNMVYTVREKELIHELRVLLKDTPREATRTLSTLVEEERGERWTDIALMVYITQCLADINCEPAQTQYEIENYPPAWKSCIINGAMVFALVAEGILQVGEQFSYSDNGISLNVNLSQGYTSIAQMMLNGYVEMRKNIKRSMRPHAAGLKSGGPAVKIRSYAPRQWTYR